LQDSIIIFEGKRKINSQALGEVIQYLQFLNKATGAVLFDDTQFWLISCSSYGYVRDNVVNRIQYCDWTLPGSASHFSCFIKSILSGWANLVIDATSRLGVVIEQGGYLGRGALGRVFKCTYQGREVAMKIVNGKEDSVRLVQEFDSYKRLEKIECAASAVTEPVSLLDDLGCAMCISPVGQAMSQFRPLARNSIKKALESLATLLSAEVSHGDARLENLIVVNRSVKWIDFVDVVFHPFYVKRDWQTIICSILKLANDQSLPLHIEEAIEEYLKSKNVDSLLDVVSSGTNQS
jgi:hypothetical protein